ncbi:expressed unknown protein [Seminavis robusta]|uniref:Uncharacterized protein n=1 Tax=Seminavis robusta TaxID=568900 RepID=A0A9N8EU42_9STRA|nr:expressed unknown protein [Seminavis robusta]|eukprot:Sro1766_g296240.1 n/a (462) ;mRNA; r:11122-12507
MHDSLTRFPSFTSRRQSKSNRPAEEMNVFCSDIVSKEYVLETLKEVRHNPDILKLEIEDLLIAKNHNAFLPVVKAILLRDERKWKHLRFIDTIEATDILWWQGMKHILMREYETTIEDKSKYEGLVSFQANVQVMPGATKLSIRSLLKSIQNDKDLQTIGFSGGLFGYSDEALPNALKRLFDDTDKLTESIVINIKCGWGAADGEGRLEALNACLRALSSNSGGLSKLEAKLEKGQRRRRRRRATSNDDILSLTSNQSTLSGTSVHSTKSEGAKRRLPRQTRPGDRPILRRGTSPRRCLTLPTPGGSGMLSPKRGIPGKSRSFNIKRPSLEEGGLDKEEAVGDIAPPRRLTTAQRSKSFRHQRPTPDTLSVTKDRWNDGNQVESTRPSRDQDTALSPQKPARSKLTSTRSTSSGRPSLRRVKSLNKDSLDQTEHGNTGGKHPDYDWAKGDYAAKNVLPSAA